MQPKIGIALGAGGARGLCHLGVLRDLTERGLAPDVVSGSSIGALVGAAYAAGKIRKMESWALGLTRFGFAAMWDLRLGAGGLVEGKALRDIFERLDLPETIEDLDLPFIAVSTDMATGAEVWHRTGKLFDAVRASIAMPGIVSPHWYQDRWHLDGGLVNPIPISAARALGAQLIIAANPNARLDGVIWRSPDAPEPANKGDESATTLLSVLQHPITEAMKALGASSPAPGPRKPGYVEVVTASVEIMIDHIQRGRLAGDPPHVLLNGTLGTISILDFHLASEAIAEGRAMVERQLEFIEAMAGQHRTRQVQKTDDVGAAETVQTGQGAAGEAPSALTRKPG